MTRLFEKIIAMLLISLWFISCVDAEESMLLLPSDLEIVETEAFSGVGAVYAIVPEGVTEIHARAFADSHLTRIDLPASLTFIAEDAFAGLTDLTVYAPINSYAMEYCIENDIAYILAGDSPVIPEEYPAIVPGIDFGGQHIYIYDYWTASAERVSNPTEKQQALYDYRDWLEETYNCKITQIKKGDWGSNITELINFTTAPDNTLCLFIIPADFVGTPMSNDLFAVWNQNDLINLSDDKWNDTTVNFMTIGGKTYGVSTGCSEPRQCLFFNKRVLEDAGIDWNTIYDMQAQGTWTWDRFERMLQHIHRDVDKDGITDIYGFTGYSTELYMMGVVSNGGNFFNIDENGEIQIAVNSDAALEGLQWTKDLWRNYGYRQPQNAAWNYFKDIWKQGICGFYIYNTSSGFSSNSEMFDMTDEWGCVAFPIGPKGNTYVNIVSDDVTVIPNVYDANTVGKLAFIYDMWSNVTPGYSEKYAWIGNKYSYTDRRAVDETYGMLRKTEHCAANTALYLGSVNDILGSPLLWQLDGSTPLELVEAATPAWQALCDYFNGKR